MDKKIFARFGITLAILIALTVSVYAGTTGKISGKVIDADTKEPLVGVTVMIDSTPSIARGIIDGDRWVVAVSIPYMANIFI